MFTCIIHLQRRFGEERTTLKKLAVYLKTYRKECVLGPLFKLLEASFELAVPLIVAGIVDTSIPSGNTGLIVRQALILCALAGIGFLCAVTAQYFAARAAIGFSTAVRHALMAAIQKLNYSDLDRIGTSTLVTRITSDVNQIQTGVNMGLRLLLRSPFVVFGAMIMAFTIDTRCALIFAGVIALLLLIVFGIMLLTMPMRRQVQERLDHVTGATRSNLEGIRVLRAFCREEAETKRFGKLNALLTTAQLKAGRIEALTNPLTTAIINLAVILLLRTGALRVNAGILTQGQVIALYNYMGQILVELIKLANLIVTLTKAAACAGRVSAVLETKPAAIGGDRVPDSDTTRCSVSFRDVSFTYPGASAASLSHVSFEAAPGETIGIIGGTGSGKTSLINLIPAFFEASSGSVLVDGIDVREFSHDDLLARIGIVPQKAVLFRGTIRSNLLWGNPDATDEDLREALAASQALDFVEAGKNGLDASVEQDGRNFSGGQRQRLTIARALVRKPEILILDDSSSALDYATDSALRRSLRNLAYRPTTFIVSQRTSSIRSADRIIVLEDGEAVGYGTHESLLDSCPVYREIDSVSGREAEQHV